MDQARTGAPPENKRAAPCRTARDTKSHFGHDTATLSPEQYGKPLAVALYNADAITLQRLQSAFDARPDWRSA